MKEPTLPSGSRKPPQDPAERAAIQAADRELDEALDESFPASDPVAIHIDVAPPGPTDAFRGASTRPKPKI